MKWCCATFQTRYEHAGETGFATLVGRDAFGQPQFIVQHRVVDKEMEQTVRPEIPIPVIAEIPIDYCPWCGRNLRRWYGKLVDDLYRPDLKITYA